jgi:tartrate-resistant acid phosphatase type 5
MYTHTEYIMSCMYSHRHTSRAHTYTVWSVGHHGPTHILDLVEKLNPMLLKYKVAVYFSGHDHDMQHLNDSGVQYFLSGAGHLVESSQKHKACM